MKIVAVTAGLLLVLTACSSAQAGRPASSAPASTSPAMAQVVGTVSLVDASGYFSDGDGSPGNGCFGENGYDDIAGGADVVISDDAGRTLAITQLGEGTVDTSGCSFTFSTKVPAGKGFYGVTVTHRGTVKVTESGLGSVALTIGSP